MFKTKKNQYIKPLKKVGIYTIKDLPELTGITIAFGSGIPLQKELITAVKKTHYYEGSSILGCEVAMQLFHRGGMLVQSKDAIEEYGRKSVTRAAIYFKATIGSYDLSHDSKEALCGWIAENIFDCEKMIKVNKEWSV